MHCHPNLSARGTTRAMRVCITLVVACTGFISVITAAPFQSQPYRRLRSSSTAVSEARSDDMDILPQVLLNLMKNTIFPAAKKHLETGEPLPRKVILPTMLNMLSNAFFTIFDPNAEGAPMMKDVKDIFSTLFTRDSKLLTKKKVFSPIFKVMSKFLPIFNKKASTDNELLPFFEMFKDMFSFLRDRIQEDKEGKVHVDYVTFPNRRLHRFSKTAKKNSKEHTFENEQEAEAESKSVVNPDTDNFVATMAAFLTDHDYVMDQEEVKAQFWGQLLTIALKFLSIALG